MITKLHMDFLARVDRCLVPHGLREALEQLGVEPEIASTLAQSEAVRDGKGIIALYQAYGRGDTFHSDAIMRYLSARHDYYLSVRKRQRLPTLEG